MVVVAAAAGEVRVSCERLTGLFTHELICVAQSGSGLVKKKIII